MSRLADIAGRRYDEHNIISSETLLACWLEMPIKYRQPVIDDDYIGAFLWHAAICVPLLLRHEERQIS